MKWKQIDRQPRIYALIFDRGDELAKGLKDFATEQNLADASLKAIGALASVRLGWFNPETKKYQTCVNLKEQVELLSMIGDVAQHTGSPLYTHMSSWAAQTARPPAVTCWKRIYGPHAKCF
jgi:predicted DNA-binding protein with PD1-like motif